LWLLNPRRAKRGSPSNFQSNAAARGKFRARDGNACGHVKPQLLVALGLVVAAALFSTGGAAIKAAHFTAWQLASFRWAIAG
jgi:hypothetical protein